MGIGQIIRLKSLQDYPRPPAEGAEVSVERVGWKADKGWVFVALVLGAEPEKPTDEQIINPNKWMERRGWRYEKSEGLDDPQQLRAQRDELLNVLIEALPYVEMAEHDEAYKPGTVKKMVNKMRKAIAHASPEPASK